MIEETGPGQTPLTHEQKAGLLLPLSTQGELNASEAAAIARARTWAMVRARPLTSAQILREDWLTRLHKRMFGSIWDWAGTSRRVDVNIGNVGSWGVPTAMREAMDDAAFWVEQRAANDMTSTEVAVRVQHRLVAVHPFPNGNGRWSRLVADLLMRAHEARPLVWGGGANRRIQGETRDLYLAALRAADGGDFSALIAFALS